MENREIECRFLEIDKNALIKKLIELGAKDTGEKMLTELIFYDKDLTWIEQDKRIRLRQVGDKIKLTYKERQVHTVDGTYEVEFEVEDFKKAEILLEKAGLVPYRHQEKLRHTFYLNNVAFDIDTWPKAPTYVELEGNSEQELKDAAKLVGYDWNNVELRTPKWVLENKYNIPLGKLRWYTFDRVE